MKKVLLLTFAALLIALACGPAPPEAAAPEPYDVGTAAETDGELFGTFAGHASVLLESSRTMSITSLPSSM